MLKGYGFHQLQSGMIFDPDFLLEVAKGNVPGHYAYNKFGNTSNADDGVITDVWDAANQPVWLAPTAARRHQLLSTSDQDSAAGGTVAQGTGAWTVRIYGLQTWDSKETSEVVTMDGTATGANAVWTANSYVIIHRMKVETFGSGTVPNVGLITAVAETDGTVTAQISAIRGQTFMAILGIPSTQRAYMYAFGASIARSSPQSAEAGVIVFQTTNVESNPKVWTFKHTAAINESGTVTFDRPFHPPKRFDGPCIIKMAFTAGADDTFGDASFDAVLVDEGYYA